MAGITQIKRPGSLSKIAEEHIREGIIRGQFQLGESLQEAKLSSVLGISKTPIREALAALNLQGLVQIFPRRGAFVFTLTRPMVEQLCGYRVMLEFNAIDLAMERDETGLVRALEKVVSAMRDARSKENFDRYLDLDADFHEAFFAHCQNAYLTEGYQKVADIVRTMRWHLSRGPQRTDTSFAEHEQICRFLKDRKIDLAKKVLKQQITRGERAYAELTGSN